MARKLRIPIGLPPGTLCRHCKRQMDPFGDHFFTCRFSKTGAHNHIRDSLFALLRVLAPLSDVVASAADVLLEPAALLPAQPTRKPADIALFLRKNLRNTPCDTLAIDVTVSPVPSSVLLASRPSSQPSTLSEAHAKSIRTKLHGPAHLNHGEAVISELNAMNIALVPFTIDLFGGLGPLAHPLLFSASSPLPAPDPLPDSFPLTHAPATTVPTLTPVKPPVLFSLLLLTTGDNHIPSVNITLLGLPSTGLSTTLPSTSLLLLLLMSFVVGARSALAPVCPPPLPCPPLFRRLLRLLVHSH